MNRTLRQTQILLLAGFTLFALLYTLMSMEGEFTGKATTGTYANITNSTPRNCTIMVYPGLNTVGFHCILAGVPRANIINDTGLWAMYQYIPGSSDLWKVHNPNLPSYVVSDLTILSRKHGYVMVNNATQNYTLGGFEVFISNIPLAQGWNLVGYPSFIVKNVSDSFSSIDNYTDTRTYNNSGLQYLSYINGVGGTLTVTEPGQGYWINTTQATTWRVTS